MCEKYGVGMQVIQLPLKAEMTGEERLLPASAFFPGPPSPDIYDRKGQMRLRSVRDDSRCCRQLSVSPATKQLTTTRADTFALFELKL